MAGANVFKMTRTVTILGKVYKIDDEIDADGVQQVDKSGALKLAAAKNGQLTTRTSDTVGTLTMAASHGITTGARLDIFWTLLGVYYARYGVTVGTVATNSVPFSLGAGDVLPANLTTITAMVPIEEAFNVVGDNLKSLTLYSEAHGALVLADGSTNHFPKVLAPDNATNPANAYEWNSLSGVTNPIAGDTTTKIFLSHGDSTAARILRAVATYS